MRNQEKLIKEKTNFLLGPLSPSKRINDMSANELRLLSGKAFAMRAHSEQLGYNDGIDYWRLVETATRERLQQIEVSPIKFRSTPPTTK
jgi:hypothetical protein